MTGAIDASHEGLEVCIRHLTRLERAEQNHRAFAKRSRQAHGRLLRLANWRLITGALES